MARARRKRGGDLVVEGQTRRCRLTLVGGDVGALADLCAAGSSGSYPYLLGVIRD